MLFTNQFACAIFFATAVAITSAAEFNETELESLPGMGLPVTQGKNTNGKSIFTNYINARKNGKFFLISAFNIMYEMPATGLLIGKSLSWCADIQVNDFMSEMSSDDAPPVGFGFSARCVYRRIIDREDFEAAGASLEDNPSELWSGTALISSVYTPQANGLSMVMHGNADNLIIRCLDDGTSIIPYLKWEVHDEGDVESSSFSSVGTFEWISVDDAVNLDFTNTTSSAFSPQAFDSIYAGVWASNNDLAADDEASADVNNSVSRGQDQKIMAKLCGMAFAFMFFF